MEQTLIVSSSQKSKELLIDIVKSEGKYDISSVDKGVLCREIIKNNNFDLIIINAPLRDDYGERLAKFISQNTNSDIILIVKNEDKNQLYKIEESGIYVMEKPINKFLFIKIINAYIIHRRRYNFIINENKKLKKTISDIKLIDRAKITLVEYLNMSEDESHKYIEKQAMDLRITKVEVAKSILKIYEN